MKWANWGRWIRDIFPNITQKKKINEYFIDYDRSTALSIVRLNNKDARLFVAFQKTPGKIYQYAINVNYVDFVEEFFDDAQKNESRSWGKTYHLLLKLGWILPL